MIAIHFSFSKPWVYIKGRMARREICAAQRMVCRWFDVRGAPKRIKRTVRIGVPRKRARVRERIAG